MDRRNFLKLTVASAAAVKAGDGGNQLGNVLEASTDEERVENGVEKFVTTACDRCSGGCGARVRLIDTRAVKVEGNPLHPVTGGGLCPVGQASLQALYSPDRVRTPLKRSGPRGSGEWSAITWDAALAELAGKLGALRTGGGADTLAIVLGRSEGAVPDLFRRFGRVFGTPHVLEPPTDVSALALWATQGIYRPAAYDLENARYILSFGVPLLEGWWSPVRQMRALAVSRQGTPGRRGKLVQFEPRLSPTAGKADEWVPLVPGTEGALALGIASVLVSEGRYDHDFVAARTFGFEDWTDESGSHTGWRTLLQREYSAAAVAAITGVPADTIHRIALEFASFGPGLAIGPAAGQSGTLEAAIAVHALNALVGSIERGGGVLLAPAAPLAALPEPVLDAVAQRGLASRPLGGERPFPAAATVADLAQASPRRRPAALLVWGADPLFTGPDPEAVRHALAEIPLVVSFASFLDDTASAADLVLPDHVFPEAWQEVPPSPALPRVVVGLGQPAVKPAHDTRHAGDVLLDLAHRLGGSVAAAFPWQEHREVLAARAAGLHAASEGKIFGADAPAAAAGKDAPAASSATQSFDDFWSELVAKGGWAGPGYRYGDWARVCHTPSGRFEFYSRTLRDAVRAAGRPAELLAGLGVAPEDDRLYLPHFAPPAELGDPASFPLRLHIFGTLGLGDGSGANQPFLQEIIAPHVNVTWDSWAELNPGTAARLGIADGDLVWVESAVGRVRVRAKLYQGVMPDVLAVVLGQGHQQLGRYARGRGANAAVLLPAARQPLSGMPLYRPRVKVYTA